MRHVPHLRPGTRYHDTPHLCCRRQFHFRAALFSPSTRASSNTVTVQHSIMIRLLDIIFSRSGFGECGAPKLNHHNFFFFSCMLYLCMHAGSISVDFSRNIASEHWRRRAGRMKLTNKQVPSVQFLLNRAAHPQSDHMSNFSINAAGATGTVHPSFFSFFFIFCGCCQCCYRFPTVKICTLHHAAQKQARSRSGVISHRQI